MIAQLVGQGFEMEQAQAFLNQIGIAEDNPMWG